MMALAIFRVGAFALLMATQACASPAASPSVIGPTPSAASPSVKASTQPPIAFAPMSAEPAKRSNAKLAIAFDATGAASLLAKAPTGVDFSTQALVCLYLGERTGPWTVTLVSGSLSGGVLSIRARETRPRSGAPGSDQASFPATCATLDRASLPVGSLKARAEDTTSGEFIVEATISVPAP
jgi:hypothetical protein